MVRRAITCTYAFGNALGSSLAERLDPEYELESVRARSTERARLRGEQFEPLSMLGPTTRLPSFDKWIDEERFNLVARSELDAGREGGLLAVGPFDSLVTSTKLFLGRMSESIIDSVSNAPFWIRGRSL